MRRLRLNKKVVVRLAVGAVVLAAITVTGVLFAVRRVSSPERAREAARVAALAASPSRYDALKEERKLVTTPLGKRVIADGKVSVEELQEVKAAFVTCLAKAGFSQITINDDSTSNMAEPSSGSGKQNLSKYASCDSSSDWSPVDEVYRQQTGDPDQIDSGTLELYCLIHQKVVPPLITRWLTLRPPSGLASGRLTRRHGRAILRSPLVLVIRLSMMLG